MKLDKITLVGWVDQALDISITEQNIRSGFRVTSIYFLNLKAMDNKTGPSNIYTMIANEHEGEEEESNEQHEGDEPGIEESITTDLHIQTTKVQIRVEECNASNKLEVKQLDYVDMPHNLAKVDDRVEEINIENILYTERENMASN
jgi:hypothetical protein